jgi:DNA-binding NtrC family response regulator
MQTELKQFTTEVLEKLSSYLWPGNTRQLENQIKCLVASVREKSITGRSSGCTYLKRGRSPVRNLQPNKQAGAPMSPTSRSLPDVVEQLECWLIEEAL